MSNQLTFVASFTQDVGQQIQGLAQIPYSPTRGVVVVEITSPTLNTYQYIGRLFAAIGLLKPNGTTIFTPVNLGVVTSPSTCLNFDIATGVAGVAGIQIVWGNFNQIVSGNLYQSGLY